MCCQRWAGVDKEAELSSTLPTGNDVRAWSRVQRSIEGTLVSGGVDALQLCLLQSGNGLLMASSATAHGFKAVLCLSDTPDAPGPDEVRRWAVSTLTALHVRRYSNVSLVLRSRLVMRRSPGSLSRTLG